MRITSPSSSCSTHSSSTHSSDSHDCIITITVSKVVPVPIRIAPTIVKIINSKVTPHIQSVFHAAARIFILTRIIGVIMAVNI